MWDEGFGFNFPWKKDVHKLFLKAFEWCLQMCCLKKPLCFVWLLLLRELKGRGFTIGYSMISEATESRYVISWFELLESQVEEGSLEGFNLEGTTLGEFYINETVHFGQTISMNLGLYGNFVKFCLDPRSPNILRSLPRLCLPGIFGPLLWGQGSPKQGPFIKEPPACRKNEPTGTLPDFSFRCVFLYVSRFGFVSTLAFVQTNILCGWCLRHSVWLKAPWVVGIFCLEKLSWRWYFWLGRNRSDEWVSEATICRVVYIPNAGLQLIEFVVSDVGF